MFACSDLSIAGSSLLDSESLLDGPDLAPVIDVHPTPTESLESSKVKVGPQTAMETNVK